MEIGQRVKVRALARPVYTNNYRKWERYGGPTEGWYVGWSNKQEGKYHPAYQSVGSYFEPPEWEQAYLVIKNVVKLFRIKLQENSNDLFAFPEDVEITSDGTSRTSRTQTT